VDVQIDLTQIILSIIGGIFSVAMAAVPIVVGRYVKDRQMREVLENAVQNSLGVLQQVASGAVVRTAPAFVLPSRYAALAPAVQYVLDHAGEAVKHFDGMTPEKIAEKIISRAGLKEVQNNIAATSSPTPAIVPPLAPTAPVTAPEVVTSVVIKPSPFAPSTDNVADQLNAEERRRHEGG